MQTHPFTDRSTRAVFILCIATPITAMAVVLSQTYERGRWMISEQGPLEEQSSMLWLLLAIFAVGLFGVRSLTGWAAAYLSLASAAREWGLHKVIDNDSMLAFPFYTREGIPLGTRALCAGIVLLIGLSAALLGWRAWKRLCAERWWSLPDWAWMTIIAIVSLGVSKMLDRSQAMLEDAFHFEMNDRVGLAIKAAEESMEMLLPLVFAAAMLCLVIAQKPRARSA